MKIVVLGVGNILMSDEGAGVRCVERLEQAPDLPGDVRLLDGGTSTHELLEDLENLDALVIVDAVLSNQTPGAITRFEADAVPSAFSNKLSPHQHGINDLLAKLKLLGRAPRSVVLFGIEPARLALDLELSPAVERAMPSLMERVRSELRNIKRCD